MVYLFSLLLLHYYLIYFFINILNWQIYYLHNIQYKNIIFSVKIFRRVSIGQLSVATSKNPTVMNTICINHSAASVITCARFLLKQTWRLTKAIAEMKCEHWTERWNWSSCTRLALSVSWTLSLIAQSVRASKRDSVVVGSNPTQANFL